MKSREAGPLGNRSPQLSGITDRPGQFPAEALSSQVSAHGLLWQQLAGEFAWQNSGLLPSGNRKYSCSQKQSLGQKQPRLIQLLEGGRKTTRGETVGRKEEGEESKRQRRKKV